MKLNSENLNSWLTLGANIGVFVGIVLLIVEMGQNRVMMQAQTRHEVAMGLIEFTRSIESNPQFASIHRRGNSGEQLTPDEFYQYLYHYTGLFRYWENVHYQYRQGLFDKIEFSTQLEGMRRVMQSEGVKKVWCGYRETLSPVFRAEIDGLMDSNSC